MDGFVALKNVKKIYQMGEVQIMAAAGIDLRSGAVNLLWW